MVEPHHHPPMPQQPMMPQPPYASYYGNYGEEADKPIDYKYYFFLLKKNFYVIFTFLVIALTLAFIYTSKIPVGYLATAQVIVERPAANTWQDAGDKVTDSTQQISSGFDDEYYSTQIAIITGTAVLKQVVDELRLTAYFEKKSEDAAVHKLREMIKVDRIEQSRILNIQATAQEPELAANIANAVSRAYIRKNFEDMLYYSREILNWLPQDGDPKETITVKEPMGGNVKQMTREELINSLPSVRTDGTIRKLLEKESGLEADLKLLLGQYREKHPKIIKARANVKFVEDSIKSEKQRIIDGLKARAEGRLNVSHARILEEAEVPKLPLPSSRNKIIAIVAIVEILISCFIIFLIDYFDDSIRSMEDLERKGLTLPFLGPLPMIKDKALLNHKKGILAFHDPKSEIAESFRYLRVSINFSASPESLKTLVLTSCLPHEGKSFTSDNIAVSLALDGNRTLLIDADMRRPTLHRVFKLDNTSGLSNYLTSKLDFDSILKQSGIEDLTLVTSGPNSPNPAAILGSDRMKEFLKIASERFDRVIVDCPPLTGIGDGFVLGSLIGHIILVIASGRTPLDLIKHTQAQLTKAGVQIIGVALNMVDMDKERYHGYSKYYYNTYTRYYNQP